MTKNFVSTVLTTASAAIVLSFALTGCSTHAPEPFREPLPTSVQPTSGNEVDSPDLAANNDLVRFVPESWAIRLVKRGDIDGDKDEDALVVLHRTTGDEPQFKPRTLMVLRRAANGSLEKKLENLDAIPCQVCGGKYGDPIEEIKIFKNETSLVFWGGIREAWSKEFRFLFSTNSQEWLLSEVKGGMADALSEKYCSYQLGPNDFGSISLKEFNYAEFSGEFIGCEIH